MPWFKIGLTQSPSWRGRPPQILPEDIDVLWRFLDREGAKYERLHYNLAMTVLSPEDIPGTEKIKEMWLYAISKRVDIAAETKTEIHLIEVTRRAGVRSLGQAILYKRLYEICRPFHKPAKTMIVCDYADLDVLSVARAYKVEVVELEPRPLEMRIEQLAEELR